MKTISGVELKVILDRHRKWLRSDTDGARANLSGVDLNGANLSYVDLGSANLRYANLSNANLTCADLLCANLSGADLTGANLTDADLSSTNLNAANLSGANLNSADLSYADLGSANLNSADLTGANLTGANLTGADLIGVDLTGADLNATLRAEVAELKVREAAAYKVYKEMSATMGHNANTIDELRAEIAELKAKLDKQDQAFVVAGMGVDQLKARLENQAFLISENTKELETARRVRERLTEQRNDLVKPHLHAQIDFGTYEQVVKAVKKKTREFDAEIAAIETGTK